MDRATPMPAMPEKNKSGLAGFLKFVVRHRALYIMLIPGLAYLIIFKYIPLAGSVIAFQDFNIFRGIWNSPWVGFKWFEQFFTYPQLRRLLFNTIIISFYQLIFAFPAPILLALLLNEVRKMAFKRTVQTIVYLPHFFSWTIVFGFTYMILSVQTGLLNSLIESLGFERINFLQKAEYFRTIIVGTGIWKETGWSAIIFLAALAGINPSLYEAAKIDGANRFRQLWHITLPGILPTIVIMLLLRIGNILDLGAEQIYMFLNELTYRTGDVLDTYTYRIGILGGQYSLTTAIGLFKSVVGFLLMVTANQLSKKITGEGLY
ncbi:ABC-type polysaccharide transport system, permease component [Thermobacillus composti KWC4]|jgi:putative aldouronate transport system permease protein|uniref:ABC-type polysaccharide transport system, permease component n=1 Tax=Thermobacillus composti (strain DSM 18247 / JCM 13945 / KWC4) TaxID=717605 RepID=L0EE22_THECK|nr:ABC transporter permease subunit [Thermobacillus composti]AGA57395.1 ABC-type polysaccharide transport system, permease component [Thermobacillus composti KWC4]